MCVVHAYIYVNIYMHIFRNMYKHIYIRVSLSHFKFIAMPKFTAIHPTPSYIHSMHYSFFLLCLSVVPFSDNEKPDFCFSIPVKLIHSDDFLELLPQTSFCSCHIAQEPNSLGCLQQVQEKGNDEEKKRSESSLMVLD